jgi:hypothetical protein
MVEEGVAKRLLEELAQTSLGDVPILVGSSGLFGFPTRTPTEVVDLALPEELVEAHGEEIVTELMARGFRHPLASATFLDLRRGTSFDFLGHGDVGRGDHIGGTGRLRVMVFEDLSRLLADPRAWTKLPHGRTLTPAGFVVSKMFTERMHKGSKDKIQALLVLDEQAANALFRAHLVALCGRFDSERLDDARADAQGALLALACDPKFTDAGAEGYAGWVSQAERGLELWTELLDG